MQVPSVSSIYCSKISKMSNNKKSFTSNLSPSFGYSLADRPYERAALNFLRKNFPQYSTVIGREIKHACRWSKESAGEITDNLMDKGVIIAEKCGFNYSEETANKFISVA